MLKTPIALLVSIAVLSACQTTTQPVAPAELAVGYDQKPADYRMVAPKDCPIISQLTREYRERLVVSKDMVVRWSDENSTGEPRILLILNEKGVSAYNALSKKGLAPALNIGTHTFVPKANAGITQGFLTLDKLPDGWSAQCTAELFAQ